MLAYFPVAYPDELLYSMIARYALHTGQLGNRKAVLRDVFATESAVAIPDLPSHLSQFRNQVNQVWQVTAEEIIKRHTLAPIYLPFLRSMQAKQVVMSMRSSQGGNIHTRCGISASSLQQPRFFRYCPLCVKEQHINFGEPYWLRSHQFLGIDICSQHQCKLVYSNLHFHPKEKHLYRTASKACCEQSVETVSLTEIEGRLISRFQELFELQKVTGLNSHQWTLFYQKLATESGFKHGARVDHRVIRQHLENDWSNTNLQCYFETSVSGNDWLVSLFRKHRKVFHPLRHLMVWTSLLPDLTVKQIFGVVSRLPKEAVRTIESFGAKTTTHNVSIQKKRQVWLNLLRDSNGAGIKAIRAAQPGGAIYAWLYRHDRQWLMSHRPPTARTNCNHHLVDYIKWDIESLCSLVQIFNDYTNRPNRPRLSRTFLIKLLPRANSIEKHLKDLPKTSNWLTNNAESVQDYQVFRIQRAAEALRMKNLPVKRWRLLRVAGIRSESVTPTIEEVITSLEV